MKKYGQDDYMCDLVCLFLEHENMLTDQQKNDINSQCCDEITEAKGELG